MLPQLYAPGFPTVPIRAVPQWPESESPVESDVADRSYCVVRCRVRAGIPTWHPLPTAHCPLPTADCPLPTADCRLPGWSPLVAPARVPEAMSDATSLPGLPCSWSTRSKNVSFPHPLLKTDRLMPRIAQSLQRSTQGGTRLRPTGYRISRLDYWLRRIGRSFRIVFGSPPLKAIATGLPSPSGSLWASHVRKTRDPLSWGQEAGAPLPTATFSEFAARSGELSHRIRAKRPLRCRSPG